MGGGKKERGGEREEKHFPSQLASHRIKRTEAGECVLRHSPSASCNNGCNEREVQFFPAKDGRWPDPPLCSHPLPLRVDISDVRRRRRPTRTAAGPITNGRTGADYATAAAAARGTQVLIAGRGKRRTTVAWYMR